MYLTMIDPATSWFEIVELPNVTNFTVPTMGKGKKVTFAENTKVAESTFDKSSAQISNLVYATWLGDILVVDTWFMTMEANSNFTSVPYVMHMG